MPGDFTSHTIFYRDVLWLLVRRIRILAVHVFAILARFYPPPLFFLFWLYLTRIHLPRGRIELIQDCL